MSIVLLDEPRAARVSGVPATSDRETLAASVALRVVPVARTAEGGR